jgi:uncharacterized protein (DUF2336 family)
VSSEQYKSSLAVHAARARSDAPGPPKARLDVSAGEFSKQPVADTEGLAWLAAYGGSVARRAVAANRRTPYDANALLAEDRDAAVRAEVGRKISWRLSSDHDPAHSATLRLLKRLASDPVASVRATLAREIRYLCGVPPDIARALARDPEPDVAAPILQCSPHIAEAELMAFVLDPEARAARVAIASRRPLGRDLCDAIVFFLEAEALSALLANPEASIRRTAVEHIAKNAASVQPCLEFLAARSGLSQRAVRSIARVGDCHVLEKLASRRSNDQKTRALLDAALNARRSESQWAAPAIDEAAIISVQNARRDGVLDEAFVKSAAERGDVETVIAALVALTQVPDYAVRRMLTCQSSGAIAELARRAGLSKRFAHKLLDLAAKLRRPGRGAPSRKRKRRLMPSFSFFSLRASARDA